MRETQHIIAAMRATGNQTGVIERWKRIVEEWSGLALNDSNAAAVRAWLPLWQSRPFYTAEELAPMWPALAIVTGFTSRWRVPKSAVRLASELDFFGLPRVCDHYKFFICERIHHWRGVPREEILLALPHAFG
jgi:hypothetical protein